MLVDLPAGDHEVLILTSGEAEGVPAADSAGESAVATPEAFKARAVRLQPGEELVVRDGVYPEWKLDVRAEGTAERP